MPSLDNTPIPTSSLLIASNRADLRQVLQSALEHLPYPVLIATDAAVALEYMTQEAPALLLLDAALGMSLSSQIKSQSDASLLVIVDSLHPSVIDRAFESGADDTIVTPVHGRTLERRVQQLLAERQHRIQAKQAQVTLDDMQRALNESNERFQALFEYSPDAIILTDALTNIIVDCNQVCCRMNGYTQSELLGQSVDILNAYDKNGFNIKHFPHESYVDLIRSKGRLEYETFHRHKNGTTFPIEVSTALITLAGRELILGIDRDITERKAAETKLREVENNYRIMTEYATDMISRNTMESVFLYASPSSATLLGYKPEELLGRAFYDLCHPTDIVQLRAHHDSLADEDEIFTDSYRIARKDGTYIWFETVSRKILNPDTGRFEEVVCVSRDITDRKRIEAAERDQNLMVEALGDATAALRNSLKTDEALDRILEQAARVVPYDAASISLIQGHETSVVRCKGFAERGEEEFVLSLRFTITDDNPFYQKLIQEKVPVVTYDVRSTPDWVDTGWIRANITVPVILHDKVIGLLHLDHSEPGKFTEAHGQQLFAFADQVAIALQSAQLYDELQALYHATSFLFTSFKVDNLQELVRQITQAVTKEFDNIECHLGLNDTDSGRVVRVSYVGDFWSAKVNEIPLDGPGLIPAAIRTGQVIYCPDVSQDSRYLMLNPKVRSELVIPLRTRYEIIGVLDLQSDQRNAFNQEDQRVLLAFAERAATAIENIQYAQELERRVAHRTGELLQTTERMEAIFNNSSDAIMVTSVDGLVRRANSAFYTLFDVQRQPDGEPSFFELVSPFDRQLLRDALQKAAITRTASRVEIVLRRGDAMVFDADVAISPIQERDYQSIGLICSVRDITERKRMEVELRKALEQERELSELKSRFVATASHEFRTPLAIIMTASDLLVRYHTRMDDDQRGIRLQRIQTEVKNIARLLDDVFTINKSAADVATEFDPSPVDIVECCREIIQDVRRSDDDAHILTLTYGGDHTIINADQRFLNKIITNLLSNAVKYSSRNTEIFVELKCEELQTIIIVRDQGRGIAEEDQKRLFQAFHRGKNVGMVSGTGMGLTIAKQAVDLHGGTITLSSTVGVGTTLVVTIPHVVIEDKNYDH